MQQGLASTFSDRLGTTASWWHCDEDHHGMAIVPAPRSELAQYAFTVEDLNAMDRVADRLKLDRGRAADLGPVPARPRQQPVHVLPHHHGEMIELCSDIAQMGDYQPRRWSAGRRTRRGPDRTPTASART
jgi:hypothetical protein